MTLKVDPPPLRRWSIRADEIDPIDVVLEGIPALNNSRQVRGVVEWCARPEHYAEGAFGIESKMRRRNRWDDRVCVENIVSSVSLPVKIYRLSAAFGLFTLQQRGKVIPKIGPVELVATASNNEIARLVVAVLGFVDSAAGLISIDETTSEQSGYWPAEERVRLALALHMIVKLRHGERWRWNLVCEP